MMDAFDGGSCYAVRQTENVIEIADIFRPAGVIQGSYPHLERAMTA